LFVISQRSGEIFFAFRFFAEGEESSIALRAIVLLKGTASAVPKQCLKDLRL
jgi:hypothetical protein